MRKIIKIGRVKGEYFGYKRSLEVDLEIEIREIKRQKKTIDLEEINEYQVLAVSGNVWNIRKTDIVAGGQIDSRIRKWLKEDGFKELYIDKSKLEKILEIWDRWHLNDLHAGTRRQEEAIEKFRKENNITGWAYDKEVEYLKSIGLYEDKGYKYGTGWLCEPLPDSVIEFVKSL